MTGCMRNSLPLSSLAAWNISENFVKRNGREKNMTKTEHLIEGKHRDRGGVFAIAPASKCQAHYGGIPSGSILHCVESSARCRLSSQDFFPSQKNIK